MKPTKLLILFALIALTSCTTVKNSTNISTALNAKAYNTIASQYLDRPTFVSIEDMSTGENVLSVKMERYGVDKYGNKTITIRFSKASVDDYLSMIEKYEKWEEMAVSRSDIFTKDIGVAHSWSNGMDVTLKLTFHSGNALQHFLSVMPCAAGTCLPDDTVYFDKKNVLYLKNLLSNFKSGNIKQKDIDAVYN